MTTAHSQSGPRGSWGARRRGLCTHGARHLPDAVRWGRRHCYLRVTSGHAEAQAPHPGVGRRGLHPRKPAAARLAGGHLPGAPLPSPSGAAALTGRGLAQAQAHVQEFHLRGAGRGRGAGARAPGGSGAAVGLQAQRAQGHGLGRLQQHVPRHRLAARVAALALVPEHQTQALHATLGAHHGRRLAAHPAREVGRGPDPASGAERRRCHGRPAHTEGRSGGCAMPGGA